MKDNFNGDNAALVRSIEALLALDAEGALKPHGVGGHARKMLEAAAVRLTPSAPAVDAGARDEREAFEAWFRQDNPAYCANEHRWEELFSLLDEVGQKADIICGSAKRDWRVWQAATVGRTPVNDRAMKLLDSIITDMEGGFVKCENCGEQEDTATLDFMPQLRELRAALSAKGESAASGQKLKESYFIEGTVRFMREEDASKQRCVCCPPNTGHIFSRGVDWDEWETNHPKHFGNGPDVFVAAKVTDRNRNEGKRVRLTVEVLGDSATASDTEGA